MSNKLTVLPCVQVESLPRCFRHTDPQDALDDACVLASMLRDLSGYLTEGIAAPERTGSGMALICDLLLDKLDVASGVSPLPLGTEAQDAPALRTLLSEGAQAQDTGGER